MRDARPLGRMAAAALLTSLLLGGMATRVSAASATSEATPPLLWLEKELAANSGTMPSSFDPAATDWGLTLDAVLALRAGGRGDGAQATSTTGIVASHVNSYITGVDFDDPGVYAGPVGKTLLTAVLQGADIHAFGGVNLEQISRGAMQTSGLQMGRFSDQGSAFGDFSNGLGQALNLLGLSHTTAGAPADAVDFLIAQQCPSGAFRLSYDVMPLTRGCPDDTQADTDATSFALQALEGVHRTPAVDAAAHHATHWLLAHQDPTTGGFGGTGPTASVNSNATGLAAQALLAAGEVDAAERAAAYVRALVLTAANTAGTPAAGDEGAIALNRAAFDDARTNGIVPLARDQWRRATAQAVLALGLPAFGPPPTIAVIEPARLLDTRPGTATVDGSQAGAGRVTAGTTVVLPVAGRGGVPADAAAVALNITATDSTAAGYITAYPCDANRPNTSNVNFAPGVALANTVITKLAANGTVCLYVAGADTQLLADVAGAFPAGTDYEAIDPARLLDTRPGTATVDGDQVGAGRIAAGASLVLKVAGRGGLPADASAVVLNITATDSIGDGYVTAYPCDTIRPNTSSLNFAAGTTSANAVITELAANGTVCLHVAGADTQLVADVAGAFANGSDYEAVDPARLLDTRPGAATVDGAQVGAGRIGAGTTFVLPVAGRGGVPADADAVVVNITATDSTGTGFITVYPCDTTRPNTSSLNFAAGATTANAAITELAGNGTVCIYVADANTQLIADAAGSFM